MTRPAAEHYVATFVDTADNLARLAGMLEESADQRRKVGIRASGELAAEKAAGVDVRAGAVKILAVLADADLAGRYAEHLRTYLAAPPPPPAQPGVPPQLPTAAALLPSPGVTPPAGAPPADRTVTAPAAPGVPTGDQTRLQWTAPGVDDPVPDDDPYRPDVAEPEPGDVLP